MAANELAIANQALLNLGEGRLLTSSAGTVAGIVETTTPQGRAIQAFYTQARQTTLRAFPWPFALKYATLALASDGTGEVWEGEWDSAYTYPTDCLQMLRFLTTRGPRDLFPPRFILGVHGSVKVIFTDVLEADANVLYIENVSTTTRFSPHFDQALAWRLSYDIAMPMAVDPRLRDWALQNWGIALSMAQRVEGNEGTPYPTFLTDGEFTNARFI